MNFNYVNTAQMEKRLDVAKKISVYISKEYFPKPLYMFCLILFAPVPLCHLLPNN